MQVPASPRATDLAQSISGAFERVAEHAQGQLAEPDKQKAVHELRKDFRRARALVRLLRKPFGKGRARKLDRALRDAMEPTSRLRDTDVLLAGLKDLLPPGADAVAEDLRHLLGRRQQEQRGQVGQVLEQAAGQLPPLAERFAELMPTRLRRGELEQALKDSFKRCKKSRRRALELNTDEALHDWRKRVKELRYQVELIGASSVDAREAREALAALAKTLGEITDTCVLKDDLRAHEERLGDRPDPWIEELKERIKEARALALRDSEALFTRPAGAFARAVLGNVA